MLWLNFILGSIFTFLCFILIIHTLTAQKQRKMKIEPQQKRLRTTFVWQKCQDHHRDVLCLVQWWELTRRLGF